MDRSQKGAASPDWTVAEEAVDPHQHWTGTILSSFWPNTWEQKKKKNNSHSGWIYI